MYKRLCMLLFTFSFFYNYSAAQPLNTKTKFTHADTLRGSIGPGRLHWNVLHYEITVKPDFNNKTIEGKNIISYIDSGVTTMQIDLQEPMLLDSIVNGPNSLNLRGKEMYIGSNCESRQIWNQAF